MARPLSVLIPVWILAVVFGFLSVLRLLYSVYKVGFKKVFHWEVHPRPHYLDDPSLGTHGYLHLEEVRIHYVASGPEDKPLMLFVHGFPEFWFSWRHQLREFQEDYRVVAFDQRGYGESDKPRGIAAYTTDKLTADIKQIILALGYKSCTLVGHDWGGLVVWLFARRYAELVDKLVVMNAPPEPVIDKLLYTDSQQRKASWYIFLFQLPFLPELTLRSQDFASFRAIFRDAKLDEEDLKAYLYTMSQPGALTPPINYYRAFLNLGGPAYDMNYTMPVLLIWGCIDIALTTKIPDTIEKQYPHITVRRIEHAHHFLQNEDPATVNKVMREWLAQ